MIIAIKIILTLLVVFPAILLIIWIPRWCAEDDNNDLPQWYLTLTDALYTAWCCEVIIGVAILIIAMFAIAIFAIWDA